jgi:hypothetical protein
MVTIKDKLISMLIANGMFESQAKEVMQIAIPQLNEIVEDYSINFEDCENTYPKVIYNVLFSSIKPIAFKWIEKNKPKAWYKPMFK